MERVMGVQLQGMDMMILSLPEYLRKRLKMLIDAYSRQEQETDYLLLVKVKQPFLVHQVFQLLRLGVLGNLKQKIKRDANKISGITKGHY